MQTRQFQIGEVTVGSGAPPLLMAGPCVIEDRDMCLRLARAIRDQARAAGFNFVFKASFDKANRTSGRSFRGPGLEAGLDILAAVREGANVPVVSDIHTPDQAAPAARVLDALQIPAFLCRQTDLLLAAGNTGKPVNVKKGQFLAPNDMLNVLEKIRSTGNERVLLTERGTAFGYHDLVVDFRSLPLMRSFGVPVLFDATHAVMSPGGMGDRSGGNREQAYDLARAAAAVGCDGFFLEVHEDPEQALSDASTQLPLQGLGGFLANLNRIRLCAR